MKEEAIRALIQEQKRFFRTGATLPVAYRIEALKKLREGIRRREKDISEALRADLGKSAMEGFMCEIGLVLDEITYMLKHIRRYAKEHTVPTPLTQFASRSYKKPSPRGTVLIMSPWNYPFLLTMDPLVDAIAAGNTAVVKPSAYSPAASEVIRTLIGECFPAEYVAAVDGGRAENTCLLHQPFDFIFFTGSQNVGRKVLRCAAERLTPAVLELGGKSPCIVDDTAKIPLTAKRIVFGKFLNCGQTCVAPDYILCQESCRDALLAELKKQITVQFGEDPLANPNYGKIISEKHFTRLISLIQPEKTAAGGRWNEETLQIAPTILEGVTWEDPVMQEEIFGPVLPILTCRSFEEVVPMLADRPKPLAQYIFSENKAHIAEVTSRLNFGGGCVNDVVIHLATPEMGFGGVGESGMGAYHGEEGFRVFSHTKSILDKKTWMDLPMRYQPYTGLNEKLLRMFLK